MDISPRYHTLNQMVKYSSLSVASLRRHIKNEGLPHFKMNKRVLVRVDEFDQWMEKRRKKRETRKEEIDRIVEDVLRDFQRTWFQPILVTMLPNRPKTTANRSKNPLISLSKIKGLRFSW